MLLYTLLLFGLTTVVVAFPPAALQLPEQSLPPMREPGLLALDLNEDQFEDYLDLWYQQQYSLRRSNISTFSSDSGCEFEVNGDLGQPQPVYIHHGGYILAVGNTGVIRVPTGDSITIACPGTKQVIEHPQATDDSLQVGVVNCASGKLVSGTGWLTGTGKFEELTCSSHASHNAEKTSERCFNDLPVIRVGYEVEDVFYPLYYSCFDPDRLEVLYTWYDIKPQNAVHQTNVDRPSWLKGSFFPGIDIDGLYTQSTQKEVIADIVGEELANEYVTGNQYLARGHYTAKTDMIYATGQRATFYFINSAPQWQPINAGNWNWLEGNLRTRVGEAGYHATVWTGTYGVTQLRNQESQLVDIYLLDEERVPVPMYFYKVIYDANRRQGTAFVTINNPYYSESEVQQLQFCTDRCRNNTAFNWLNWQPDRIDIGYSFCCTVEDFRQFVPHLPSFVTNGLLT